MTDQEANDFSKNCTTARRAIVVEINRTKQNRGKMKCPICADGELKFSKATFNGHIHACCSTQGCVAWIE